VVFPHYSETTNEAAGALHTASDERRREAAVLSDEMTSFFARMRAA
jgi:hypothetical protein